MSSRSSFSSPSAAPGSAGSSPLRLAPLVGRDLVHVYGDHVVLDGVDLLASPGQPLGLVGENGSGKSTLLRVLAGRERPTGGTVSRPADLGYLPQEPTFPVGATLGSVLDAALAPLHDAVTRLETLAAALGRGLDEPGTADEYDATLAWVMAHDGWDAERRALLVAQELGLGRLERDRPVASMSGGERSRLALAALLTRQPECLLLDEPSNHLDEQAVALLEQAVTAMPGVVVVASHDRTLLDTVCRAVVDLDPTHPGEHGRSRPGGGGGRAGGRYTGSYSDYLTAKQEALRHWRESFEAQQDELDDLRRTARSTARQVAHDRSPRDNDRTIYPFKSGRVATAVSRRVRDAERRIEVLQRQRVPKPPAPLVFAGVAAPRAREDGVVVAVRDLRVADRLSVPHLVVSAGDRLLVSGANGSGKSTLLKVLAGRLPATAGEVSVAARRLGYLPQDVTFSRPERSALETYVAATGSPRPLSDLGLLHPRDHARPVGLLSEGQRRRLALALLVAAAPSLMLLDEPTNHISLALADELEESLRRSPGTVVVATHDRWLRRRWDGARLALSPCAG